MIVVGLDCAPPRLVFERYLDAMPNVRALMEEGTWGPLRSSEPPITVPAWTCMVSGRDPGELGLYGFRNRVADETTLRLATNADVRVKRVWDWLGEHGFEVAALFVPLTTPPSPVRGQMVSGFLWPGPPTPWCFPASLGGELEKRFGRYRADVEGFRTDALEPLLDEIYAITRQHFDIAAHVWVEKKPDFMMMVEIALDRFHHAFWRHIDPDHPKHERDNRWRDAGRAYYAFLDERIGDLRSLAGKDTAFLVVSDHGARPMRGGFCINDWLRHEGYLALEHEPDGVVPWRHDLIDWSRTQAWAEGGYYARVFLNVAGRDPMGSLSAEETTQVSKRLRHGLESVRDHEGNPIPVQIHEPAKRYRVVRGFPPDLMLYFDDLALRAIGSVGHDRLIVEENDIGPDACNHDWDGVFVICGGSERPRGRIENATIYDVAPWILAHFGVEVD